MRPTQRYVLAFSRVLMALIFLLNGLGIISLATKELIEHGTPAGLVPFLMLGARTLQVVAGLGLALGIYPRLVAIALLVFLVPTTLLAHGFCHVIGTAAFTVQLLNFSNTIAGGLLFIGATHSQPTLLPRTSQLSSREQQRSETAPPNSRLAG